MLKLCRVDIGRSKEIFEKIEGYKDRVVEELKPQAVVLFGSFAKRDISEGSDVDIMVIADFKEGFLDRIRRLLDLNNQLKLPLEPVGYTPTEFARMREERKRYILEVIDTGRILYGKIPQGSRKS